MELLSIYNIAKELNTSDVIDWIELDLTDQEVLNEANLKKLYTKSINDTPKIAGRSDAMGTGAVRYYGLSEDGTLNFKVKSQTRPGKYHYAFIESEDLLKFGYLMEQGDHFDVNELSKLLTMNGFRIQCNCESFLYWAFQYMATVGGYEIVPETRAPKRNNVQQKGALCKHLILVVKNLYENQQMRAAIAKDIDNYLRMLSGMDYEDYQQLKHAKQIKTQNRAVRWKNKPSDYMNEYFARQAKHHPFLDDHDIVKSLRAEVRKYVKANPQASIDDFLKDYFSMTKKAFADEMSLPENNIDDYFNKEIDFENQKVKANSKVEEPVVEDTVEDTTVDTTGNKVNII